MKRETRKTIDAIRNSMMSKFDHMKDTANDAEHDVAQVMKDFVYSLNKEQRRNERIRKLQYIAIGIGAIAAVLGLAGLIMPKRTRHAVDTLKEKTADTAENISNKTHHAVNTLKEKTAETYEKAKDKVEELVDDTVDAKDEAQNKTEDFANNIKSNAKQVKKEWEKPL